MVNPKMDFGCAVHCRFAEQCLGEFPPELFAKRDDLLKDRVAIETKRYLGRDFRRVGHATRVARYAEEIVREEKGDPAVVLSAAYLKDLGLTEAKGREMRGAPQDRDHEVSDAAREILTRLGARQDLIEEVCDIISRSQPGAQETMNFKVLHDADLLVNLEEEQKVAPKAVKTLEKCIEESFLTRSGRDTARRVLLESEASSSPQRHRGR